MTEHHLANRATFSPPTKEQSMRQLPKHLRNRFHAAADYQGVSVQDLWAQFKGNRVRNYDIEAVEDFLEPIEEHYTTESLSAHERVWLGYQ